MRVAALPPQRRAGADDQVLPPRGTATARRADQPRPGAVRPVTPAEAEADPRPRRGGRAVHRRHRRPARRQRIAGNQPARRARQGTVCHDLPVRAPAGGRVLAGRRPQAGELIRGRGWRAKPDTRPGNCSPASWPPLRDLGQDRPVRPGRRLRRARRADRRRRPGRDPRTAEPGQPARRGSSSAPSSVTSCSRRCGAWPGRTRPRYSGSGRHHSTGDRRPAEASQKVGAGQPLAASNLASHPAAARTGDR
jgi:hypothetical protein